MNFLFSTLLIVLIVIPGFILFRTYLSGKFSKKYTKTSLIDEITLSVIPGVITHFIAIILVQAFTPYYIKLEYVGLLLTGTKTDEKTIEIFKSIEGNYNEILLYNLSIYLSCFLIALGLQKFVRSFKLDRKYRFLRFSNDWHYVLTGETIEMPDINGDIMERDFSDRISLIFIDVLLKAQEDTLLYSGILRDYQLAAEGRLDYLTITHARRKEMTIPKGDEESDHELEDHFNHPSYYKIEGDIMVIPFEKIINLNLTYFIREEPLEIEEDNDESDSTQTNILTK